MYSYDDFLSAANKSGTLGQFSQYDLALAQKYPEFGLSLVTLKQDYAKAATPEARSLANTAAENLRKNYGNYTAGASGGGYYAEALSPTSYNSAYGQQINQLLGNVTNRQQFSYNPETDPDYSAYRKQYLREGQRATADTLGQASAATGGIPSTAAVTAATQAGDYYAGQLADKVPELSQQAYGRYLNNYNLDISALEALQNQDQTDYARLLDQINTQAQLRQEDASKAASEFEKQYNLAAIASEYGDYSGLQALDISPNLANVKALAQAKKVKTGSGSETGKPKLTAAQAASAVKSGITADEVKYAYDYYFGEGSYETAKTGTGGGKPTLTAAQAASAVKSGITSDEVKYAYDYYFGEGSYEMAFSNTLLKRFKAGDFSDKVIAGLVKMGYTQKQIVDSGYAGDYFKKNLPPETPTQSIAGNYQVVSETLAAMKASGVSNTEILTALKEVKGELSQTDYMSLYNKYRG